MLTMVEFLKTQRYAKVLTDKEPNNKSGEISGTEEVPYNPEFVKKVLRGRASKGKAIKTADFWK